MRDHGLIVLSSPVHQVVDILVLSDLHKATELKATAISFLLAHKEEVFSQPDWKVKSMPYNYMTTWSPWHLVTPGEAEGAPRAAAGGAGVLGGDQGAPPTQVLLTAHLLTIWSPVHLITDLPPPPPASGGGGSEAVDVLELDIVILPILSCWWWLRPLEILPWPRGAVVAADGGGAVPGGAGRPAGLPRLAPGGRHSPGLPRGYGGHPQPLQVNQVTNQVEFCV